MMYLKIDPDFKITLILHSVFQMVCYYFCILCFCLDYVFVLFIMYYESVKRPWGPESSYIK